MDVHRVQLVAVDNSRNAEVTTQAAGSALAELGTQLALQAGNVSHDFLLRFLCFRCALNRSCVSTADIKNAAISRGVYASHSFIGHAPARERTRFERLRHTKRRGSVLFAPITAKFWVRIQPSPRFESMLAHPQPGIKTTQTVWSRSHSRRSREWSWPPAGRSAEPSGYPTPR